MSAQSVWVQGAGGVAIEMSLPLHESIEDQIVKGFARIVNPDGSQIDETDRPVEAPKLVDSRPPLHAPKADWVSWAVFNDEDPDTAASLTKQDLIERYGQVEAGSGAHVAEPRPTTGSVRTAPNPGDGQYI